jgi:hypothetical protein
MFTNVGRVEPITASSASVVAKAPPSLPTRSVLEEPGRKASACWSMCTT